MSEHDQEKPQIIIIKRVKKIKKGGHHGGSWKIAYADFVTAMMAFFLLLWLLSLLNKSQLTSVADYFKKPDKTGLVEKGTRVNKDKQHDFFLEKGEEKGKWKDLEKEKKKEDEKEKEKIKSPLNEAKINQGKNDKAMMSEQQKLMQMKSDLESKLDAHPELRQFKNQLNFVVTADGLRIELRDLENKTMFTTGKADFEKYAQPIVNWLGQELNNYPNQVVLIGHTDSAQYRNGRYTNWELSADRANATRRTLIKHGMDPHKIMRVIGEADMFLYDKKDGLNPANRRIEIIILSDEAAKKIENNNLEPVANPPVQANPPNPPVQNAQPASPSNVGNQPQ